MSVPPDAGMSLLGTYGLRNPTMVWLLNRRPDLLAETPKELEWQPGTPPICGFRAARMGVNGHPNVYIEEECQMRMVFRYIDGKPFRACYRHRGVETNEQHVHLKPIERPTPKMQTVPDFDLFEAIGASLNGASLDLRWDDREGKWALQETR